MRERPILFSAPMVRAILSGRKTQTRRVVKWPTWVTNVDKAVLDLRKGVIARVKDGSPVRPFFGCPYGQPGDRLWVKEAWQSAISVNHFSPRDITNRALEAGYDCAWAPLRYLADGATANADALRDFGGEWGRVRSSLHMPRWASRITLEVVSVRVERLQSISEEDARAEGVECAADPDTWETERHYECDMAEDLGAGHGYRTERCHVWGFRWLWDSINGAGAWDLNPFVWVVEFKRVAQEARAA